MSVVGYARISTPEQRLDLQTDALHTVGAVRIFTDTASGARASRPGLVEALDYCREGDTLAVWRLDRLGRNTRHLLDLVHELDGRGIALRSLTEGIDASTPAGRAVLTVLAALAEMERELTLERTRAGLDAARARGHVGGRPRSLSPDARDAVRAAVAAGMEHRNVAALHGVSVSTVRRALVETAA